MAIAGIFVNSLWLYGISGAGFGSIARSLCFGACRALSVTVILYLLYMLGMLGAGDVKLCGMAVLFLDWGESLLFLVTGFLVAGGMAFIKMLYCRNLWERFSYFCAYVAEVLRSGKLQLYFEKGDWKIKKQASLHMAGPLLVGLLFCLWKRS